MPGRRRTARGFSLGLALRYARTQSCVGSAQAGAWSFETARGRRSAELGGAHRRSGDRYRPGVCRCREQRLHDRYRREQRRCHSGHAAGGHFHELRGRLHSRDVPGRERARLGHRHGLRSPRFGPDGRQARRRSLHAVRHRRRRLERHLGIDCRARPLVHDLRDEQSEDRIPARSPSPSRPRESPRRPPPTTSPSSGRPPCRPCRTRPVPTRCTRSATCRSPASATTAAC